MAGGLFLGFCWLALAKTQNTKRVNIAEGTLDDEATGQGGMMRAIMELRGIGAQLVPQGEELIDQWIKRNVVEFSIDVRADRACDEKHREFLIAKGHAQLGEVVSKHFNPYPEWISIYASPDILCRLKVLVFKNDFGLGKL